MIRTVTPEESAVLSHDCAPLLGTPDRVAFFALIAAAPHLLDAARQAEALLSEVLSVGINGTWELATLDELRTAIAAADTKEPLMQTSALPAAPAHTPGPWHWDGYSLRPTDPDPDRHAVHTILESEHIGWGFVASDLHAVRQEADANLSLIAAAPQLLDAAQAAADLLTRQKWQPGDTFNPEAVVLAKLMDAIIEATMQAAPGMNSRELTGPKEAAQ